MNSGTIPNANSYSSSSSNTLMHQRNRNPTDPLTAERLAQLQNESPEISRAAEVTGMEDTSSPMRFNPTDKELITDYLLKKIKNEDLPNNKISEVDVFKHHPTTIIANHPQTEEGNWYFLSPSTKRTDKKGDFGQWRVRGTKKKIFDDNGATIGERRFFNFHEQDQTKTDFLMQKYALTNNQRQLLGEHAFKLDDYVLCKIYTKNSEQGDQVPVASGKNEDLPPCDFIYAEDFISARVARKREKLQLPDLNLPVPPSNQVADLGNLQFRNNIAVQNPAVWLPAPPFAIHPSPADVDQFYHSRNYNPQGIQMTPPPYLDFVDDDANDGSNCG